MPRVENSYQVIGGQILNVYLTSGFMLAIFYWDFSLRFPGLSPCSLNISLPSPESEYRRT